LAGRQGLRPGGRSARVQASVHEAARTLLATMPREDVTVPAIAERAGVTPSTIYRRWGGLAELLADIAAEHLRPETEPADSGDARADLLAWAEQYAEEMASAPGRAMVRDVLYPQDGVSAGQCCDYSKQQVAVIAERARVRGQPFPPVDAVIDGVVAPILYAVLFRKPADAPEVEALVDRVFSRPA
jgi:AcrR family transcriptional regulator